MDINVHVILDESPALLTTLNTFSEVLKEFLQKKNTNVITIAPQITKAVPEKIVTKPVETKAPETPQAVPVEVPVEEPTDAVITDEQNQELRKKMTPLLKKDKTKTMDAANAWLKANKLDRLSHMMQSQMPDFLKAIGAE
ncbi:hypothetical protein NXG27_04185 [Megasphaera paucivorans]|uniref:Uncharacterized protein n=1 Tax=Megasphaera paucivorans TaxID=349095 RepID=A0A1G9QUK1_9FIRM|nr:hypothetical protein [Megasphaera paucivorans]SDM14277.1 hypothetical protein SAMN05660299_00275 [Megasphaera paucivorans]